MIIIEDYCLKPEGFFELKKKEKKNDFKEIFESYTIKKGDTLTKIIEKTLTKYGITVTKNELSKYIEKIANDNSIKNPDLIYPGEKLKISLNVKNNFSKLPVNGIITSGYGPRLNPITKKIEFHKGIDISAPEGTPVKSVIDGIVIFAGEMKGYGKIVIIKNGNIVTKYAHNSKIIVKKGEHIKKGDIISLVGSTGLSTSNHLHFEVLVNNRNINPMKFLKFYEIAKNE